LGEMVDGVEEGGFGQHGRGSFRGEKYSTRAEVCVRILGDGGNVPGSVPQL
jgi:hypothetical protein